MGSQDGIGGLDRMGGLDRHRSWMTRSHDTLFSGCPLSAVRCPLSAVRCPLPRFEFLDRHSHCLLRLLLLSLF